MINEDKLQQVAKVLLGIGKVEYRILNRTLAKKKLEQNYNLKTKSNGQPEMVEMWG